MVDDDKQPFADEDLPSPEQQLDDTRHKLQRLAADFDNFRKRTLREKEDLQERALRRFLLSLLPVVDDFERAVLHVEAGSPVASAEASRASTIDGFRMILGRLQQVLQVEGVRRFAAVGERFTPLKHEAVDHVHHDDVPAGHVIRETSPGYDYGDEVLRPARVVVSKGAESDSILFEFDIEEEETTEPNREVPEGLADEPT
jgi:molecular chaperone GrpE